MECHRDKVDWGEISQNQKLSGKFMERYKKKLNFVKNNKLWKIMLVLCLFSELREVKRRGYKNYDVK
jgi:hypothetical protein